MFGPRSTGRERAIAQSERTYFVDGAFAEYRVAFVPQMDTFPDGLTYAFQYVAPDRTPLLRYDGVHGVHERHDGPDAAGKSTPSGGDLRSHYSRFLADVEEYRRGERR